MTTNKKALDVYNMVKSVLNAKKWKYDADDEALKIVLTVTGEDLPMKLRICISDKAELVSIYSSMTFNFPTEKIIDAAIATSSINYIMSDGSFDLDIRDGEVLYRLTSSFKDSLISEETIDFMVGLSLFTIDKYNDMFMELAKGYMSLEDFLKKIPN